MMKYSGLMMALSGGLQTGLEMTICFLTGEWPNG